MTRLGTYQATYNIPQTSCNTPLVINMRTTIIGYHRQKREIFILNLAMSRAGEGLHVSAFFISSEL